MSAPYPFLDVDVKGDLPDAPTESRYLDFVGGEKELRCFLVPHSMSRAQFLREHGNQLDAALQPVYEHRGVLVRQDCSYALPGFYIVSYAAEYDAMDYAPWSMHVQLSIVLYETRRAMRTDLGVGHIHLYYEEKDEPSCTVHYWLLPVESRRGSKKSLLTHIELREYLGGFRFRDHRPQILTLNRRMEAALRRRDLKARQNAVASGRLPPPALREINSTNPPESRDN